MAKKEECTVCKKAKMGGYAGEIKCTFYGRKPQFDETPCSNFVDAGKVVCNLDKPKPQSVPSKKTAAEIINEHKQQEDDLREEIRKKYNIEGDISEEQYKQLWAIYKEEENNKATPKNEPKQTINKKIVWIIAIVLGLGIILAGLYFWNNHVDRKNATYTIRIDDIFEYNCGLVTEMDVTVYECNESGATIYENNITFNADGSRDFVARNGAKSIKVLVEVHGIDPTRLATQMYHKASGWLPMAYALNPDRNTVVTMNRQTNWSNVQP